MWLDDFAQVRQARTKRLNVPLSRGVHRTTPKQPLPSNTVAAVDNVKSALARVTAALPAAEDRPGQQHMATAVNAAVNSGKHLIVQAGTGTGKTLGYLVPAILTDKRIVVATATKALQDQLAAKDLPFLEAHLGKPFDWAVLKGRSNYICMQQIGRAYV